MPGTPSGQMSSGTSAGSRIAREARLWYWQRISAMVLAVCVVVHLATIVLAVRGGLSAGEILGRTQGNWAFAIFYLVFVLAVTVHAPIGLARIVEEWLGWRGRTSSAIAAIFAVVLLGLGLRAVWSVFVA